MAANAAFIEPFGKLKGIDVINTSPTETAKIQAMVQAGKVEWDLVDVGGRTVWQGGNEGFLEAIEGIPMKASETSGGEQVFTAEYVPRQTGRLGYALRISARHYDDPLTRPCHPLIKWSS